MTALKWRIIAFLWACSGFLTPTANTQTLPDYFSAPNLLSFADDLYLQKDYARAAGEYSRFLIAYPDSPRVATCRKLIACQEKIGLYPQALRTFTFLPDSVWQKDCDWVNRRQRLLFRVADYAELQNTATYFFCSPDTQKILLGFVAWRQQNYASAYAQFNQVNAPSELKLRCLSLTDAAVRTPHKSPWLAAGMSAIIPGSGKFYLGRKTDALLSLLTTGVAGWRTYVAFDNDGLNTRSGWIYGGLTAFFYGGTIYGSYIGAKIYNRQQHEAAEVRLEAEISVFLD